MTVAGGPTVFGVSLLTYCGLVGYLIAFVNSPWVILRFGVPDGDENLAQRPILPVPPSGV
jgi:hypothetical protein